MKTTRYRSILYKIAAIDPKMMDLAGIKLSDEQLKKKAIANMFRWVPSLPKRKPKPPKAKKVKKPKKLSTKDKIEALEKRNAILDNRIEDMRRSMTYLRDHMKSSAFMADLVKGLRIEPDGTITYKSEQSRHLDEWTKRGRDIRRAKAEGSPVSYVSGITITNIGSKFAGAREGRSLKRYPEEYYEAQVRDLFGEPKIESK